MWPTPLQLEAAYTYTNIWRVQIHTGPMVCSLVIRSSTNESTAAVGPASVNTDTHMSTATCLWIAVLKSQTTMELATQDSAVNATYAVSYLFEALKGTARQVRLLQASHARVHDWPCCLLRYFAIPRRQSCWQAFGSSIIMSITKTQTPWRIL